MKKNKQIVEQKMFKNYIQIMVPKILEKYRRDDVAERTLKNIKKDITKIIQPFKFLNIINAYKINIVNNESLNIDILYKYDDLMNVFNVVQFVITKTDLIKGEVE